jgi:membrane protease YdiL (CAAX protease family)
MRAADASERGYLPERRYRHAAVAAFELLLCAAAVALDLLLPTLVILAIATILLRLRHLRFADLGFCRPEAPWRFAGTMLALTVGWTVLQLALFIPVLEHATGERQDLSAFDDLQGNALMLLARSVASWILAALGEETAFRGYVATRVTDIAGGAAVGLVLSVAVSAAMFAAIHTEQGAIGVAATALDAIFFSALRLRFDNLWAAVLAHGFNNTIGLTAYFLAGPFYGLW